MFVCVPLHARTDDAEPIRRVPSYCGIYAVYGALKSVGIGCQFRDLVRSEYVTSSFGSKLEDLEKAATERGAVTAALTNMTADDLADVPCPVVLHAADERRIGVYNHWVLYLGVQDGLARVVDAPHELELMPFSELLARWDSVGLLISDRPIDLAGLRVRHWLTAALIMWLACAFGAFGWYRGPVGHRLAIPSQVIAILGFSALAALGFHGFARDGLLRNAMAVQLVQQSHLPIELPQVSTEEFAERARNNSTIVIDARFERAFDLGHIAGAINIPLTASRQERSRLLNGVPRDKELIVYCESERCSYADQVGRSLVIDGYRNVSLYPAGWRTWSSKKRPE